MNIEKWSIERILELPNWCFGRKYVMSCSAYGSNASTKFDISDNAMPDKAVIWQLSMVFIFSDSSSNYLRIAHGTKIPADDAEFNRLPPLISGIGQQGAEPRHITGYPSGFIQNLHMKHPIESAAGRMILAVHGITAKSLRARVCAVVSGIPKEVPDWLSSGRAGRQ